MIRRTQSTTFFSVNVDEHYAVGERLKIDEVKLGIDPAVPCGLVVNEPITNALKPAFQDEGGIYVRWPLSGGMEARA
jgi:two-component sensor histidine kinase